LSPKTRLYDCGHTVPGCRNASQGTHRERRAQIGLLSCSSVDSVKTASSSPKRPPKQRNERHGALGMVVTYTHLVIATLARHCRSSSGRSCCGRSWHARVPSSVESKHVVMVSLSNANYIPIFLADGFRAAFGHAPKVYFPPPAHSRSPGYTRSGETRGLVLATWRD
jgi:hypothetical protein